MREAKSSSWKFRTAEKKLLRGAHTIPDLPLEPTDGRHPTTHYSSTPAQRSLLKPKAVAFGMKLETCSTGFCPSLCSLHGCKNEAKTRNHMSSIRLHLFPLKYHSIGQYLSGMVNPISHLSLAQGKLCWTRPKNLHEQTIKWVKAGARPSFPRGTAAGRCHHKEQRSQCCLTPSRANPARNSSDPSHQHSQGHSLGSPWKSFPENRRSLDQAGLWRSHWLGD